MRDKQLCPPGKCGSNCKCKCTGSVTVDDGGSTVPCSCKHPCPADCACRDASSALGRVLAVAARSDIGAYMGAVFQRPKEELCGKRVHPLGCVEGNTCTCWKEFVDQFNSCKCNHSPAMLDVTVKPPRQKIVADAHSLKQVAAAIERQAFFGQKRGTAPAKKLTFKRDSHMSMFEDKQQDNLSFTHAMKAVWQFNITLHTTVSCVFMSSDQCAGKVHGRRNYGYIARVHLEVPGSTMIWNMDCARHGTAEAVGDGASFKSCARPLELGTATATGGAKHRMSGTQELFHQMVNTYGYGFSDYAHLSDDENAKLPPAHAFDPNDPNRLTSRVYHYNPAGAIDGSRMADWMAIKGSKQYHSFRNIGQVDKIACRTFTRACRQSMLHNWDDCETTNLIGTWHPKTK